MSAEMEKNLLAYPNIGDGGPAAALALERLADSTGRPVEVVRTSWTALPASLMHRRMTGDPEQARKYTQQSESMRTSRTARLYAAASAVEFALRASRFGEAGSIQLTTPQEYLILGLNNLPERLTRRLGIEAVRLVVADVYPKESGALAVSQREDAVISVWNSDAYEELTDKDLPVELTQPFFLEGFCPNLEDFHKRGLPIVAKSSGSGMPSNWEYMLRGTLARGDIDWSMHITSRRNTQAHQTCFLNVNKRQRIEAFFDDLGGNTRALIGYPSELVGIACEMRSRGVPVWLITLPPRGQHEKRNLEYGVKQGLVRGEIAFDRDEPTTKVPYLKRIHIGNLINVIKNLDDNVQLPSNLGSKLLWTPLPARN